MATTEDMSQSSAADGIKMLPKSDLVGKNQESRGALTVAVLAISITSSLKLYHVVLQNARQMKRVFEKLSQ